MAKSSRVLLVEEQPATRAGLILAIRGALPDAAIVPASSGPEGRTLLADQAFDLALFDFSISGGGGLAGLLDLLEVAGDTPVLVVCARCNTLVVSIVRGLDIAGVVGKADPLDTISAAIRQVMGGASIFPETAPPERGAAAAPISFSRAQLRVLTALGTGQLNKQIAGDLGVTEATIKAHLSAIFRKLGVTNRTQALLRARSLFPESA